MHKRGKPFAQRQILLDLDPVVEPYITELVHRRPRPGKRMWRRSTRFMSALAAPILLAAITLASEEGCCGSEYLGAANGVPILLLPRPNFPLRPPLPPLISPSEAILNAKCSVVSSGLNWSVMPVPLFWKGLPVKAKPTCALPL